MKTVEMFRNYTFKAKRNVNIQYLAGATYFRVPEASVRAITLAGAGQVVTQDHIYTLVEND